MVKVEISGACNFLLNLQQQLTQDIDMQSVKVENKRAQVEKDAKKNRHFLFELGSSHCCFLWLRFEVVTVVIIENPCLLVVVQHTDPLRLYN